MSDAIQRKWRFFLDDIIWSTIRDDISDLLPLLLALKNKVQS